MGIEGGNFNNNEELARQELDGAPEEIVAMESLGESPEIYEGDEEESVSRDILLAEEMLGQEGIEEIQNLSPEDQEITLDILDDNIRLGEIVTGEIEKTNASYKAKEALLGTAFSVEVPEEVSSEKVGFRLPKWLQKTVAAVGACVTLGLATVGTASTAEAGVFDVFTKNNREMSQTINQVRRGIDGAKQLTNKEGARINLTAEYEKLEAKKQNLQESDSQGSANAFDRIREAEMNAVEKKHQSELIRIDLDQSRAQERFNKSQQSEVDQASLNENLARLDVRRANEEARYLKEIERLQTKTYQSPKNTEAEIRRIENRQNQIRLELDKLGLDSTDIVLRTIKDVGNIKR